MSQEDDTDFNLDNTNSNIDYVVRSILSDIFNEVNTDTAENFNINPTRNIFSNMYFTTSSTFDFLTPFYEDMMYEQAIRESMEMEQPNDLHKTENTLIISSQTFMSLCDDIRKENSNCTVCINDFQDEDMISITKCNHIFHTDCIKEWGSYKPDCPICREKLQ